MMPKKYCGFDEAFNIFSKIDNKRNKLNEFKLNCDKNIDKKCNAKVFENYEK